MVAPSPKAGKRRKLPKTPPGPTGGSGRREKPAQPERRQMIDVDNSNDGSDDEASTKSTVRTGKQYQERAIRALVEDEKPLVRQALEQLRDRAKDVEEKISSLETRASLEALEDPGPREDGASFLAAKQTLLLSYCRELCSYAGSKGRGEALRGGGSAGRLVELRTIIEKLRPMDRKLKYQTDKLLRLASSSSQASQDGRALAEEGDEDDPLSFRPRPDVMAPWGEDVNAAGEISGKIDGGRQSSNGAMNEDGGEAGLYRAPRLSSVPYDEDGAASGAAKGERRLEKRREKVRRGEVMETLREEFGEQPETVRAVGNAGASGVSEAKMKRLQEEDKDRLDFEEDHMVRLTVTRKAKKARAQMEKDAGRLETIADVGSAADFVRVARDADGFGVDMEGGEDDVYGGKRGRKGGGKSGALGRAMGAVGGGGMSGGGGSRIDKGQKKQRRR